MTNNFRQPYPNELMHYGILGMKWGVRRYQNADGTLTNAGKKRYSVNDRRIELENKITASEKTLNKSLSERESLWTNDHKIEMRQVIPNSPLVKFMQSKSENVVRGTLNNKNFKLYDSNGKPVGDFEMYQESPDTLNGVWLGIKSSKRGQGYATSVMRTFVSYAKINGYKHLTLEVPGSSPDARHIYEKLGFYAVGTISSDDDVWEGLTAMRLDLK